MHLRWSECVSVLLAVSCGWLYVLSKVVIGMPCLTLAEVSEGKRGDREERERVLENAC